MKKRARFYVDGFNLYYAINELKKPELKWLDLDALCRHFLNKNLTCAGIKFFTTYKLGKPETVKRHQTYVRALESKGIDIVFGAFKKSDIKCNLCHRHFSIPEEKQTDVNIAISLITDASQDNFDTAVIISGDTDLLPVIKCMREHFTGKDVWFLFPMNRSAKDLQKYAHFYMKIKESHIKMFQFDDKIEMKDGSALCRPKEWASLRLTLDNTINS